ncbi:PAS domain-containing sensor histidine kinase [Agaricicola taiwanensis]|uniref:histidine kinase n=1 Tax=Agaricicola taiwanensis TaxID=591372 RepID=A0A8J2YIN6_9RHOB|nr:PAS domain-containing sensor histidine kinase [Agaricicola taiwanensis]GGE45451.1 PAS domain-containing sensor histidine kinase [Agaricicola taiwanensis]
MQGWIVTEATTLQKPEQEGRPAAERERGAGRAGFLSVALALISAFSTFVILGGLTSIEPTHTIVVATLFINLAFALVLLGIIAREFWIIARAKREGFAGAQLHGRVVALFSVIAAVPGILLAVVAFVTIDRSFDNWFSSRVLSILNNSLVIAEAYRDQQVNTITADAFNLAATLNRNRFIFDTNRAQFNADFQERVDFRALEGAFLLRSNGEIVQRATADIGREFSLPPPGTIIQAEGDSALVLSPGSQNLIGAIIKLDAYEDLYLFVARPVDERATQHLRSTESAVEDFSVLAQRRLGAQVAYGTMYLLIALTLALTAIWLGLSFANRLVSPVRRLITAADQVSGGNLYVQVPITGDDGGTGDLGGLSRTFNNMTSQLRVQRNALLEASEQIDRRRRFTEAMLAGVSAGVVGLDSDGNIALLNKPAARLLAVDESEVLGKSLNLVAGELAALFDEAAKGQGRLVQGTVEVSRGGRDRILNARVTSEQAAASEHGYVVTLDDITELVSAQRTSAWADVARRIAHEIKNPLTPIQLSVERIKRKYGKVIVEDRDIFDHCTDTIVRQVDDIKRMVDEFSSFARMPKPVMAMENIADVTREIVVLMRVGNPDVEITLDVPEQPVEVRFDRRQVSQALTNIIKNATEAIAALPEAERQAPRVDVRLTQTKEKVQIDVIDNGVGLPAENRHRLLEPYMTTREKGTGLGLAIVAKIFEDHGGGIELLDAPAVASGGRGAMVRMYFPTGTSGALNTANETGD